MMNTIQTDAVNDLMETTERIALLMREIGMLRTAQSHLDGIPARQNAKRISDRMEMLSTYAHLKSAQERLASHDCF